MLERLGYILLGSGLTVLWFWANYICFVNPFSLRGWFL